MKVSRNWLQEYLDFELPPIDELVQKIGSQLGAVEEVTDLSKQYQGIAIVKVVSCQPHPDADKLKICKIDDGMVIKDVERDNDDLVQVVCGALNVDENLMVTWIPPGATVPNTFGEAEPFILEAREIRGQKSNGMLASGKELAIGDSHEGLLLLDVQSNSHRIKEGDVSFEEALNNYHDVPNIKPGDDFAEVYRLNDYIIEIENKMFTHRPDCFGILGVAREIAGIFGKPFTSPAVYLKPKTALVDNSTKLLEIRNELPELVPRFVAQVFEQITIGPSPVWMQTYLSRVGIRPINNIVDITNYFMVLTGQPLHAYDLDKLKAIDNAERATLVIRHPKEQEKLTLLSGKEIEPQASTIMIASATKLIGIGGVMGGSETEVDEHTKNIVLECAQFDMYSIRRTSMANGLFTDAVTRFSKGQSPLQNDRIVAWAQGQIICDSGAIPSDLIDNNNLDQDVRERDSLFPSLSITPEFINSRLGIDISAEKITSLLKNVEFEFASNESSDKTNTLKVLAPFWRTDIELPEDIVEEVGRLYGFDKLPLELPKRDLSPSQKNDLFELKAKLRSILATAGANELLTYSFVHGDLLQKVGQDSTQAYQLSNALSPDLQYYRLSLTPSLLEKVHPNIKAGFENFALFELGKTHIVGQETDGIPTEFERLAFVITADEKALKNIGGAAYYSVKKYLDQIFDKLGLVNEVSFDKLDVEDIDQATKYYDLGRAATIRIGDIIIGRIGEYKASVRRELKLPNFIAGFEIDLTPLKQFRAAKKYRPLSRFPKVTQDITLKVSADLAYQKLLDFLTTEINKQVPSNSVSKLETIDIYQNESDKDHKNITFRITITANDRTLTDKEVSKVLDNIADKARTQISAERI